MIGIMESVDMLIVTKGDGNLLDAANQTKMHYMNAMKFIQPKYPVSKFQWQPPILVSSVVTKLNFDEIEDTITKFHNSLCTPVIPNNTNNKTSASRPICYIDVKRTEQKLFWMNNILNRMALDELHRNEAVNQKKVSIRQQIQSGQLTPTYAARLLYDEFLNSISCKKDS